MVTRLEANLRRTSVRGGGWGVARIDNVRNNSGNMGDHAAGMTPPGRSKWDSDQLNYNSLARNNSPLHSLKRK